MIKKAYGKEKHNCTRKQGHQFEIIREPKDRDRIRESHPKMLAPLWSCTYCNKIIEAT